MVKAVTWQGRRRIEVVDVPPPVIEAPSDALVRVTSSALCGSDLHLYELMGPFLEKGDILGHEAMGVVTHVGAEVTDLAPGDRVVIACQVACGRCEMCRAGVQSQCETTQQHETGKGAALFGYTSLYGSIPGLQAELARIPSPSTR